MKLSLIAVQSNGWFARHGISAEWAAVLSGLISAAGILLAIYLGDWLPSGVKRREQLSKTLNEFAHVLLGLADDVEHGRRPTQYGHRLSVLLLRLDDKSRQRIRKVAIEQLIGLEELADKIQTMDHNSQENERAKAKWIHDARAVAGEIQAIAVNPK